MPADDFDDWRMARHDLSQYVESVEEARSLHPEMPVRLGLEVDYMEGGDAWLDHLEAAAPWDYLIGSVHYLPGGWDVDNPKWLSLGRWEEQTIEEVWQAYFTTYEQCIRSRRFDFCAHPDLVKKFGHRPAGDLRRYYEPVIEAAVDTGTILENNTGLPVVISSDAHRPADVGRDFERALAMAQTAGFQKTARFQGRQRLLLPL
jgi:histidinol-phosphatase (PHP family)